MKNEKKLSETSYEEILEDRFRKVMANCLNYFSSSILFVLS